MQGFFGIRANLSFGVQDLESRFQDNERRPHSCYPRLTGLAKVQNSEVLASKPKAPIYSPFNKETCFCLFVGCPGTWDFELGCSKM